jgi:c-di-GMP-binding flagellar brake protein YcgR
MFRRWRRRRTRREPAGWPGHYALAASPRHDWERVSHWSLEWSRCRVVDVSMGGAALELFGPNVAVGDSLVVDLQLVRNSVARVTLSAEVRREANVNDIQRIGIQFVDVSDFEDALLRRLLARQKHERGNSGVVSLMTALDSTD